MIHSIKIYIALILSENGKFSIEQASHFSNLSLYNFMDKGELENEMKLIKGKNESKIFRI